MDKYNNRSYTLYYFTLFTFRTLCVFALHFISLQLWHFLCFSPNPPPPPPSLSLPRWSSMNSIRNHVFLHTYNKSTLVKISLCIFMCLCMPCVYNIHTKSKVIPILKLKVCAKHITKWFGNSNRSSHNHSCSSRSSSKNNSNTEENE